MWTLSTMNVVKWSVLNKKLYRYKNQYLEALYGCTAIIYIIVFLLSDFIKDFPRNVVELRAEIDWSYFQDGTWEVRVEDQTSVQSSPDQNQDDS